MQRWLTTFPEFLWYYFSATDLIYILNSESTDYPAPTVHKHCARSVGAAKVNKALSFPWELPLGDRRPRPHPLCSWMPVTQPWQPVFSVPLKPVFQKPPINIHHVSWSHGEREGCEDHGIWSHHFMGNRWRNSGNSVRLYFGGAPKSLQMVIAAMKLKGAYSLDGKLWPT